MDDELVTPLTESIVAHPWRRHVHHATRDGRFDIVSDVRGPPIPAQGDLSWARGTRNDRRAELSFLPASASQELSPQNAAACTCAWARIWLSTSTPRPAPATIRTSVFPSPRG